MAWQYFIVCLYDFLLGPQIFYLMQMGNDKIVKWNSITLEGGGLYHLAMAAIVGITAWTRGQEKLHIMQSSFFGMENNGGYGSPTYMTGVKTVDTFTTKPTNEPFNNNPTVLNENDTPVVRRQPI